MKISEVYVAARRKKAGMIPYFMKNGEPVFLFMVPSDPAYGGSKPSIAKGHVDEGESPANAAVREAEEELGLIKSNIIPDTIQLVWSSTLTGDIESYDFLVYACEVKSMSDFATPHYETGSVHWLDSKEFDTVGRKIHRPIVIAAREKILKKEVSA